jgi:hypothetical protein
MSDYNNSRGGNKAVFGFIIILIGLGIFFHQVGWLPFFHIEFTWPIILIIIGLFVGMRKGFRTPGPYILIAIGVFNLIPGFTFRVGDRYLESEDLVAPLILVLAGLVLVLRPGKKKQWTTEMVPTDLSSENTISADIIFGGRKEIITSKDFKGGRITATFGGCEVNLLQADSTSSTIVLEMRATFGGCELIVPANWDIKNEIEPIFGGVEDQRMMRSPEVTENRKTLILRGSCVFGGIEIKSF